MWGGRDHYAILFDGSVMGLEKGAQVYLNGIRVGSVSKIEVAPEDLKKVRVEIVVESDTPIHTDTKAVLQMAGITGLRVIDLRDGTLGSARLEPGATIAQGSTTLDKLEKQATTLADKSTELVSKANKVMANLEAMTDPMSEIVANTKAASASLAGASSGLDAAIAENRVALRQTIASVGATANSAQVMIDGQFAQLIAEIKTVVRDNGSSLRAALADLRTASRSFKELSREVRQKPSRLLFSGEARDRKLP
jgi:phospholipid/cholesterol/gamma-HCH transport system substrate-binding protein